MTAWKRVKAPDLGTELVKVFYSSEWGVYKVTLQGAPRASYYTDDRLDALATAQRMRNNDLS